MVHFSLQQNMNNADKLRTGGLPDVYMCMQEGCKIYWQKNIYALWIKVIKFVDAIHLSFHVECLENKFYIYKQQTMFKSKLFEYFLKRANNIYSRMFFHEKI